MLDVKKIVDIINKLDIKTYKFDYNIYNEYIQLMYNWYRGKDSTFHYYTQYNGKKNVTIEKARLNMAKRVCEDNTSLTFNENVALSVENKDVHDFLLGYDEMSGILGHNDFWSQGSKLYELTCALGTGAFEIVCENLLKVGDKVIANKNSKIKIVTHNATEIIPLTWDNNGNIKDVAFVDQYVIKTNTILDMRIHILDELGNYKIINKKLKVIGTNNINIVGLHYDEVVDEFNTGSSIPWFSIMKLPIINNYDIKSPMGASVYGNCIDVLKNIDDAFNTLCTEYRFGSKKVFYDKSMLNRDKDGNVIVPDDANKSVFYYVGDDLGTSNTDGDVKSGIHEFNPELRIEEINAGIDSALNYLSVMCGLGNGYYKFSGGAVSKTATEVISQNSSMYRNIRKNQLGIEKCLLDLCKTLIYVNNKIFGTNMDVNADIAVIFDSSIIEDMESVRKRDLNEVELGIMTIDEYRAKYYEDKRNTHPIKSVSKNENNMTNDI